MIGTRPSAPPTGRWEWEAELFHAADCAVGSNPPRVRSALVRTAPSALGSSVRASPSSRPEIHRAFSVQKAELADFVYARGKNSPSLQTLSNGEEPIQISLRSSPFSMYMPRVLTSSAVICGMTYAVMIFLRLLIPLDMLSLVLLRPSG